MSLPELQQNPLVQRVIDIFDTDRNGEVDFKGSYHTQWRFNEKQHHTDDLPFLQSSFKACRSSASKATRSRSWGVSVCRRESPYIFIWPSPLLCHPFSRLSHLRHGQWWLHLQRRALPSAEDDGGQQPEGHTAAADCRQDDSLCWQGRGRQNILWGVLQCKCLSLTETFFLTPSSYLTISLRWSATRTFTRRWSSTSNAAAAAALALTPLLLLCTVYRFLGWLLFPPPSPSPTTTTTTIVSPLLPHIARLWASSFKYVPVTVSLPLSLVLF